MVEKAKNTGEATLVFLRVAQEVYGNLPAQNDAAEAQTPQAAQVVEQGQVLTFVVEFSLTRPVSGLEYSIQIYELGGRLAFATTNTELGTPLGALQAGTHEVRCLVAAALPEGEYTASFAFAELANAGSADAGAVHLAALEEACSFRVQLPPERHAQGYMQLPSSLLYQQKSRDVVVASPPIFQTVAGDSEGDEWVWEMNAPHPDVELEGFSNFEAWGVWTDGPFANIKISSNSLQGFESAYIYIYIKHKAIFSGENNIKTFWSCQDSSVEKIFEKNSFQISSENRVEFAIKNIKDDVFVGIKIANPAKPSDFSLSSDSRSLGLGLDKIIISKKEKKSFFSTIDILNAEKIISQDQNNKESLQNYRRSLLGSSDVIANALANFIINNNEVGYPKINLAANLILELISLPKNVKNVFLNTLKIIYFGYSEYNLKNFNFVVENNLFNSANNKLIVVGGFMHSGSSAVYDFLRGHPKASTLADVDIESPDLVRQYSKLIKNQNTKEAIKFFFENILNFFIPENFYDISRKSDYFSLFLRCLKGEAKISLYEYAKASEKFAKNIVTKNIEIQKKAIKEFIFDCTGSNKCRNDSYLLLNQTPWIQNVEDFSCFPKGSIYIAVNRDPRDQYISNAINYYNNYGENLTAEAAIKDLRRMISYFDKTVENLSGDYNFLSISYEDFVTQSKVRDNICRSLGIDLIFTSNYFDPDLSKKRIQKYKNVKDKYILEQIAIIEKELPEYLWHGEVN